MYVSLLSTIYIACGRLFIFICVLDQVADIVLSYITIGKPSACSEASGNLTGTVFHTKRVDF